MTAATTPAPAPLRQRIVALAVRSGGVSDVLAGAVAVALALLAGAVLVAAVGKDVPGAFGALLDGAFGSTQNLANTLVEAVPLALVGVGVSLSFRAGLFNVGAEGQLLMGGLAAGLVGSALPTAPAVVVLPAMVVSAMAAGACWASIASLVKVYLGANEMLNTIMLNYVATYLVTYLLNGPVRDPSSALAQTTQLSPAAGLPILIPGTTLHGGLVLAVIAAVVAQLWLSRRVWGFRLKVVGLNPEAALGAGLPVRRTLLSAFAISGALAGLAGFCQVAGVQGRMIVDLSPGYGYSGIVVALLGRTSPIGSLIAAFFFGALSVGGQAMETSVGVPASVVTIIQYLVVLLLIARGALQLGRGTAPAGQEA
ncbi:ABC-type transporter, integral membrane subunit [Actinobacteria bacterium OK074]|nr:ABC-type transporter, integral membrane subunit [Actinobacteria bacterium OK074]